MKICYLVENINLKHGGGRYANDLISEIKKYGHDAIFLEVSSVLDAAKARKYCKNCDVIHAIDGYPYGVIAALASIGLNKKLVITVQGTYAVAPLYSFGKSILVKWAYKKADKIIAISQYTKKEILKKVNIKNIEVINHGVYFDEFYKKPIESEEKFILSIGALKYRKGYHISIPAFAMAKKEIPDLKYKIISGYKDEKYFDKLKNLTAQYGVEKDIEFLSDLSDESRNDLYSKAKLFILTSVNENHYFEGFGLVFLEAAAAGLPVIGTLGNGIEDAVKNNFNGILIPQNDIKAASEALIKILKNEQLRKELSLNSYSWAKDNDWSGAIAKYIRVYKSIV